MTARRRPILRAALLARAHRGSSDPILLAHFSPSRLALLQKHAMLKRVDVASAVDVAHCGAAKVRCSVHASIPVVNTPSYTPRREAAGDAMRRVGSSGSLAAQRVGKRRHRGGRKHVQPIPRRVGAVVAHQVDCVWIIPSTDGGPGVGIVNEVISRHDHDRVHVGSRREVLQEGGRHCELPVGDGAKEEHVGRDPQEPSEVAWRQPFARRRMRRDEDVDCTAVAAAARGVEEAIAH
mmetsp:Transcript_19256/g.32680  ORF Transcript_19256/g.32680 Transcript_19256/m.32680 type:complete len:236 (+) Transcript_19256:147-854(+)